MINKIDIRIKKSDEIGFRHDSRRDVRTLTKICNILIDKVNELVEAQNNQTN